MFQFPDSFRLPIEFIDRPSALEAFCTEILQTCSWIAVDTEFLTQRTYWPVMCLIQIGTSRKCGLVDVLTLNPSFEPLRRVFSNPDIVKIIHAADSDVPLINMLLGETPQNIFDTQMAEKFIRDNRKLISLKQLVNDYLNIDMAKSETLSNWAKRPLTQKQILYAAEDVIYLKEIFDQQMKKLDDCKKTDMLQKSVLASTTTQIEKMTFAYRSEKNWTKFKNRTRSRKNISALRRVFLWRENVAFEANIFPLYLVADKTLLNIANSNFSDKSSDEIFRELRKSCNNRHVLEEDISDLLEIICNNSAEKDDPSIPEPLHRSVSVPSPNSSGPFSSPDLAKSLAPSKSTDVPVVKLPATPHVNNPNPSSGMPKKGKRRARAQKPAKPSIASVNPTPAVPSKLVANSTVPVTSPPPKSAAAPVKPVVKLPATPHVNNPNPSSGMPKKGKRRARAQKPAKPSIASVNPTLAVPSKLVANPTVPVTSPPPPPPPPKSADAPVKPVVKLPATPHANNPNPSSGVPKKGKRRARAQKPAKPSIASVNPTPAVPSKSEAPVNSAVKLPAAPALSKPGAVHLNPTPDKPKLAKSSGAQNREKGSIKTWRIVKRTPNDLPATTHFSLAVTPSDKTK